MRCSLEKAVESGISICLFPSGENVAGGELGFPRKRVYWAVAKALGAVEKTRVGS